MCKVDDLHHERFQTPINPNILTLVGEGVVMNQMDL